MPATASPRRTPARSLALLAAAALLAAPLAAQTTPAPPPSHLLTLSASAASEVDRDWMTLVLSATREGPEAAAVQAQLRQALDAALADARGAARPGQVELRSGNFSLQPRYAPPPRSGVAAQPGIVGWVGTAELVVEGRDHAAIAQLAGRIKAMSVARLQFSLSREAREKAEAELTASAIARFRARASAAAKAFGYTGWQLREVNVGTEQGGYAPPQPRALATMKLAVDEALPVEAGRAEVAVQVSGSVQLTP